MFKSISPLFSFQVSPFRFFTGVCLILIALFAVGCGSQPAQPQDGSAGEEADLQGASSNGGSAQESTPIPTVDIPVEAEAVEFEVTFYSTGMLESGDMLISFSSDLDIPGGNYQALLETSDGSILEYSCSDHPDIPKTILCVGQPVSPGQTVAVRIEKVSSIEEDFDFSQAQDVADLVFGGSQVSTIWQAWDVVNQCALLSATGELTPAVCDAFAGFTPNQSGCTGPADCTQQCGTDLGLGAQVGSFNPQDVWDALAPDSMQLTAACQDFISLQQLPWAMPLSMGTGTSSIFLALLTNAYEDPFFLDAPELDDQPVIVYEAPIFVWAQDVDFKDPNSLGEKEECVEAPFFFGAQDACYEDPFFITNAEIVLGQVILTSDDPPSEPGAGGNLFLFPGLVGSVDSVGAPVASGGPAVFSESKEVLYGVATGLNPMAQELFNSFLPDMEMVMIDPGLGGTGAGGPGSPQDGGTSGAEGGEPTLLEDVSVEISEEDWETFDACVALIHRPETDKWDTFGLYSDYYYSRMIRSYQSEMDGVFRNHPECTTSAMLLILKSYETYFWDQVPDGFRVCAADMGHTLYDFMAFGGFWGEEQAGPLYDQRYSAFCSQLNAYALGAPEKVPESCKAEEFITNFFGAGYCDDVEEIPYVVYQCLEALGADGPEMYGDIPMYPDNLNYIGVPHLGGTLALNNPGSLEEAYYLRYLDYWNDPEKYGDGSNWPAPCTSTAFIDWLEQAEQNRYGIDPATDSPYEGCPTCSVVYDCTTSPNLFSCAESSPEGDLFTETALQCALDVSWPGSLDTPQHTANLVAYLTAAAPWMEEDSMTDACETTLTAVASFSPGLYPGFLRSVLGIWGTNGTSIWGRGSTTGSAQSAPLEFQVPALVLDQNNPGGGSSGGSGACTPQPCESFEYWDADTCACQVVN